MKFIFSKKAGLQMSINAIVVLVMAMVVLGLGLGFIRGMFSSAEGKFAGAIDAADLTTMPTSENPITFEKQTVTIKKGSKESFIVAYYNNDPALNIMMPGTAGVTCSDAALVTTCFTSPTIPFAESEAKGFNILVDLSSTGACSGVSANSKSICSLEINGNSKQFFLEVK